MDRIATAPTPYCGAPPPPDQWLGAWNLDPLLLAVLAVALVAAIARRETGSRMRLLIALGLLAALLVSPFCALTSALFSARAAHHLVLVGLVAPLLAWSAPWPRRPRIAIATLVQQAVFWVWHAPAAYDAALSDNLVYWIMQLSILATALWFWMQIRGAPAPAAVGALLAAMVSMGLLGALLTVAPAPLYAAHALGPLLWGTTPLADQQVAGLIMWAPGAALYLGAALWLLGRLLGPSPRVRPA